LEKMRKSKYRAKVNTPVRREAFIPTKPLDLHS
jgi:hypothetical protein